MKAKEIIFLILFIVAGVFFYYAQTGKIDWEDYISLDWNKFTYEESKVIEPPFPPFLKVLNAHGVVEVQGTETDKISFTFEKTIWRRNEAKAKEIADRLRFVISKDESGVTLSTNREDFKRRNFETSFRLTVPLNMDIDITNSYDLVKASRVGKAVIKNRHGEVTASEVNGDLELENSYEDIDLEGIRGNCQIKTKHSTAKAKAIEGEVKLETSYGEVNLRDVGQKVVITGPHTEVIGENLAGSVEIHNSYENISLRSVGPITIEGHHSTVEAQDVNGNLDLKNTYGSLKTANIRGSLSVSGKHVAVSGKNVVGETISISSSYEDIELSDFSGKTAILLSHGNVTLSPLPLTGPLEVRCDYAPITLYWPRGEQYPFEAQTKSASIDWRLAASITTEEKDRVSIVRAFTDITDKPRIFLTTTYNDIRIEEGFSK